MLMLLESAANQAQKLDLTRDWTGFTALGVFFVAYLLVMLEGKIHLRKSKPVMMAAGIIWVLVAVAYGRTAQASGVGDLVRHNVMEFAELFLFILAAVTYVNTMEERLVFDSLRSWLVRKRLSLRAVFWISGVMTFFLSAVLDNLTTALVMGTVVLTVGRGNLKFMTMACINVVVAANAGGAFSPFGDITTLMVWQAGIIPFFGFFALFVPAVVNWLVPATIMSLALPSGLPRADDRPVVMRQGALVVLGLFAATIATAVTFYNVLSLPPFLGMMTGLAALNLYGFYLQRWGRDGTGMEGGPLTALESDPSVHRENFDIFRIFQRAEWDTFMFFYGIILSVGGLATMGYLAELSNTLYAGLGATIANTVIGAISAIVDNIPVMFAVISMNPPMDHAQWLLVTLTTGVGGSMLSVGSAAGVALMGHSRGVYTFADHLRWTWAIALGYAASIGVHLLMNGY